MTDASLQLLLDDTQAQLDAAFEAISAGGTVDLSDLPPRVETICRLAVESGVPGTGDRLRALIERLDTLELTLRAVMTTAQAMAPAASSAGRRRAAQSYRVAAEADAPGEPPPAPPPGRRDG
jgi:hypothetical protein